MASEICCCGNVLAESSVPIRRSPCRCEAPGEGHRQRPDLSGTSSAPEHQARLRHSQGLPAWTDTERGLTAKWD